MLPIEKAEYLDRLGLSERDFTEQLNAPALACYLPPIVERHGKNKVIMDGIHRIDISSTNIALMLTPYCFAI